MIARRFTMRAHVERNIATGKDAYGHPVAPNFQPVAALACFAWVPKAGVDIVDGKKVAIKQDVRMMFGLGADLTPGDRIAQITNSNADNATVYFRGPLRIEGDIDFKHNHHEVALVRVAG